MIRLDDTTVDLDRLEVRCGTSTEPLTPLEASLLRHLAAHPGQAVSRGQLLREVWSYADGVQTQAVRACVRRLRQKLEHDPDAPRWLKTVRGAGWMLDVSAPVAPAPTTGLPVHAGRFVGRQRDLQAVRDVLHGPDPVVLLGPGGIGKTRLVCELARTWPGEVAFADLTDAADLGAGRATVARALGLPADALSQRVGAALAGRDRPLLILDNLESIPEVFADAPTWLEAAPDARVAATSQLRPGLPGERALELAGLDASAGIALFEDRAVGRVSGGAPQVAEVVDLLDGLPLAIELVAARTTVLDLPEIEQRLRTRILPLAQGRRLGAPARHQGLGAALDAAWDRLDLAARRALAQLSVFRGAFSVGAAEAVIDADRDALDLIQELRDRSLVRAVADRGPWRLGLTRAIREYAAARLTELGGAESALARHAYVVLREARAAVPRVVPERVRENLWAVHRRFAPDDRACWALVWLARPSTDRRGARVADALDRLGRPHTDDPVLVAALELARQQVLRQIGRNRETSAVDDARAALALCGEAGDTPLELDAITHVARTLLDEGAYGDAAREVERGLDVAADRPDVTWWTARLLMFQATIAGFQGRPADAVRSAARASELARHADPDDLWPATRLTHATELRTAGRLEQARELAAAALRDTSRDHRGRVGLQVLLGALCVDLGHPDDALHYQLQALDEQARWGEQWPLRYILPNVAVSYLLLDRLDEADAALARAPTPVPGSAQHQGRTIITALLDWGREPDEVVARRLDAIGEGDPTRVEHARALAACIRALAGSVTEPASLHDSAAAALIALVPACAAASRGDREAAERCIASVSHRAGSSGQVVTRQVRRRLARRS